MKINLCIKEKICKVLCHLFYFLQWFLFTFQDWKITQWLEIFLFDSTETIEDNRITKYGFIETENELVLQEIDDL